MTDGGASDRPTLPPTTGPAAVPLVAFEDLPAPLAELLRPRYERLGYLGGFFSSAAHQPEALAAFVNFSEASKGALPEDLVEVIAITAATLLGNDYERHQHERLSVRLGLGRPFVAEVERLHPEEADLTDLQRLVQRYVLAALPPPSDAARPALERLVQAIGVESAVAVVLVAARYAAHSVVVGSVGVDPPVPSIWEDGFGE